MALPDLDLTSIARVLEDSAVLEARGDDALKWVNGQVTQDVRDLHEDRATYSLIVNPKGRVAADAWIHRRGESVYFVMPRATTDTVIEQFDKYIIMEDVELLRRDDLAVVSVQGAGSSKAAAAHSHAIAAARFGSEGVDLLVAAEDAHSTLTALDASIGRVDESVWNASLLARGIPRFGADFGDTTYPQEAGLETRAVSFQKGCYLGQEVICMLENRGQLSRKLVRIEAPHGVAPSPKTAVTTVDGVAVGEITTSADVDGRILAHAIVKRAQALPGTELRVNDSAFVVGA
jgi:folate-binding protein YgfZ